MHWVVAAHVVLIAATAAAAAGIILALWSRARVLRGLDSCSTRIRVPEELVASTRQEIETSQVAENAYPPVVRFISNPVGSARLRVIDGAEPHIRRLHKCFVAGAMVDALFPLIVYLGWKATWWWLLGLPPVLIASRWIRSVQSHTNITLFVYSNAFDRLFCDEEWESSEAAAQARATLESLARHDEPR